MVPHDAVMHEPPASRGVRMVVAVVQRRSVRGPPAMADNDQRVATAFEVVEVRGRWAGTLERVKAPVGIDPRQPEGMVAALLRLDGDAPQPIDVGAGAVARHE